MRLQISGARGVVNFRGRQHTVRVETSDVNYQFVLPDGGSFSVNRDTGFGLYIAQGDSVTFRCRPGGQRL
jgi:hypothetical protein